MSVAMSVTEAVRLAARSKVRATKQIKKGRSEIIFIDATGIYQWALLDHETGRALITPLPDDAPQVDREVAMLEQVNWRIEQAKVRMAMKAARKAA